MSGARRGWLRLALALGVLLATPAGASGPTDVARVDAFLDAPRALFGDTEPEVLRRLGPPVERHARSRATFRDPSVRRRVERLVYPGVVVEVHERVVRVELRAPDPRLPWGLGVGVSRATVETALGEPQESSDRRVRYIESDGFPKTVTFHFEDGRVLRIDWEYWLE